MRTLVSVAALSTVLFFAFGSMSDSTDMPTAAPTDSNASASASPKEGDSCEGMGAMDGAVTCDGKKLIFCSSYSDYKWKATQTCSDGQKCVPNPDGKSAGCEAEK